MKKNEIHLQPVTMWTLNWAHTIFPYLLEEDFSYVTILLFLVQIVSKQFCEVTQAGFEATSGQPGFTFHGDARSLLSLGINLMELLLKLLVATGVRVVY